MCDCFSKMVASVVDCAKDVVAFWLFWGLMVFMFVGNNCNVSACWKGFGVLFLSCLLGRLFTKTLGK